MKIKEANGFARILKIEGIPWVSCYPTNYVNNALGEEGVPILMMGEERFGVAVAGSGSWGGRCLILGDSVTGPGATRGAGGAGGCECCLCSIPMSGSSSGCPATISTCA